MSGVFCSTDQQEKDATASKQEIEKKSKCYTQILKLNGNYRNAGSHDQKYYLSSNQKLVQLLGFKTNDELRDSIISARLNGYIVGKGDFKEFERELKEDWKLSEESKKQIYEFVKRYRG